ncbi:hypothetical protein EG328_007390 [Venturia inaequalis]|uniref:Uncharacterized protein n=1 Tax=Venturia inaequalis TaxID=5025 RepID=A0A8H3VI13_VENIN|nr:hypothetical protein EG328_007390 [Venturia inaequalis]
MADGYNDARAMRVAEIMADFRNLQYYIAQIQANPPPEDYYLEGYTLLRACVTEGRAILASPYAYGAATHPQGEPEAEKSQLQAYALILPWLRIRRYFPVCLQNTLAKEAPPESRCSGRTSGSLMSLSTRTRTWARRFEG